MLLNLTHQQKMVQIYKCRTKNDEVRLSIRCNQVNNIMVYIIPLIIAIFVETNNFQSLLFCAVFGIEDISTFVSAFLLKAMFQSIINNFIN